MSISEFIDAPTGGWQQTRLWNVIERAVDPEAKTIRAFLQLQMPQIERVLSSAGTSPKDFTLHDAEHAFRVAQKMAQIIPEDVLQTLSTYELALLLLSAYLHDIGMTPEYGVLKAHFDYLAFATPCLTEEQQQDVQEYLDSVADFESLEPPLLTVAPTPDRQTFVERLVAHYARHKHNDWSQHWIEKHLPTTALGGYYGWRSDLVMLCRSHHEGYSDLLHARFNPRMVGNPGRVVHFRYLAAVLRMADILDFDPERSPEIIFEHRGVDQGSIIYWWKDHEIGLALGPTTVRISARPTSALAHRAILSTVDDIDTELRLCRMLDENTHFDRAPGVREPLPHRWQLPLAVTRDIQERDNRYIYVDGSFRPNTGKLLELLGGNRLYQTPFAAVRELLQNAFDAVKEAIALRRLDEGPDANPEVLRALAELHSVVLRFYEQDGRYWLSVADSGVGMTRAIITDQFLVSGSTKRQQVVDLERRCRKAGFRLERTGQFGIGALSYFMLADFVEIETRRTDAYGDNEATGWLFQSGGIGSFGELKRAANARAGTIVRLRLRPNVVTTPGDWYQELKKYVAGVLVYVPCRFRLTSDRAGLSEAAVSPGWVRLRQDFEDAALLKRPRFHRVPSSGNNEEVHEWLQLEAAKTTEISARLRWCPMQEGELPRGMGRYRLTMPYFEYPAGWSTYFLDAENAGNDEMSLASNSCWKPQGEVRLSWRGMRIDLADRPADALDSIAPGSRDQDSLTPDGNYYIELDFLSDVAGWVGVSRSDLHLHPDVETVVSTRLAEAVDAIWSFLRSRPRTFAGSEDFVHLRDTAAIQLSEGVPLLRAIPLTHWIERRISALGSRLVWTEIRFPAVRCRNTAIPHGTAQWRGRAVQFVEDMKGFLNQDVLSWSRVAGPFDSVAYIHANKPGIVPIWSGEDSIEWDAFGNVLIRLPPAWDHIYMIEASTNDGVKYRNRDHPITQLIDAKFAEALEPMSQEMLTAPETLQRAQQSVGTAAAWLAAVLMQSDTLQFFIDHRELVIIFFDLVFPSDQLTAGLGRQIYSMPLDDDFMGLMCFGPEGFDVILNTAEILSALPDPGEEWTLRVL